MSKYDEDLKKACEILNNTELDELVQVAVEAMDDAATDIGMEASQEWHAKITLESALIHIAEKVAKRPSLTIPKSIAEKIDKEIMADAVTKFAMFHEGFERLWLSDELEMYCANKENYALASAYLNPLTRDLVKVVADE